MWITIATLAGSVVGVADVALKLVARSRVHILFSSFLVYLGCFTFWTSVSIFSGRASELVHDAGALHFYEHLLIGLRAAFLLIAYAPGFLVLGTLDIATYAALRSSTSIFAILAGVICWGDRPSLLQWSGMTTMIAGVCLMTLRGRIRTKLTLDRSVTLVVISSVFAGGLTSYDKFLVGHFGQKLMMIQTASEFWRAAVLGTFALGAGLHQFRRPHPVSRVNGLTILALLLAASTISMGEYLALLALSYPGSLPSIVSILRRLSLPVAVALAYAMFRERISQRAALGMGVICFGVVLVNWT